MIDINQIRKNPLKIKQIINSGRSDPKKADIDNWLKLDQEKSRLVQKRDEKRRQRNDLSKGKKPDQETILKVKKLKVEIEEIENDLKIIETKWQEILDWVPNIPISEEAMPFGKSEADNPIIKAWTPQDEYIYKKKLGKADPLVDYMPKKSLHWDNKLKNPKHHLDLGTDLQMIHNSQGSLVSGSRFTYLTGDIVKLQYALQQLAFNELLNRKFTPIIPPLLVKDKSLYGTSHFPEGKDQIYCIKGDNIEEKEELNLVGSSEPSSFSFFINKVLNEKDLPIKIFAYTPCFRSEAGSWGKDTKGIKRMHQFDKIEINAVTTPNQSEDVFNEFLTINEWLLQKLELPYRLALKCTADAGYHASAHQIDPEGWLPAQQEFIELGTDTNATDFQARRLNIKFTNSSGEKKYAHTVNDTCIAMGRTIIAIMDNYQQSDGSIKIPKILQRYIGQKHIKKV